MEEIFGKNGLIAKHHKDYEYRAGQIQMAEAVLRAFEQKKHLIVEAGTGTGKTLAYLVPAIAAAIGKKKAHHYFDGNKKFAGTIDGKRHSVFAESFAKEIFRRVYERSLKLRLSKPHRQSGKSADSRRLGRDGLF